MERIKVGDVIDIKQSTINKIVEELKQLSELRDSYVGCGNDIVALEGIKREMGSRLTFVAELFSNVKKYKSGNHTYLEDRRKQLKASIMKKMYEDKNMTKSDVKELVYDNEEYKAYMDTIMKLKKRFIEFEEVYNSYQSLYQSIIQSISVLGKSVIFNQD